MHCSKSPIWRNSAYATAVQIFDLVNGELQFHLPTDICQEGGDYYEKIHIKNTFLIYSIFYNIYYKSKIAPTPMKSYFTE